MKFKLFTIAITIILASCSNNGKSPEIPMQISSLKSDMLMQSVVDKPFSRPNLTEKLSLTLTGASLLEATATFKVIDENGMEIHCETFPSKELIQPEYRTANSVLQEAHIRDVVKGYFVDEITKSQQHPQSYAGL